MPDFTTGVAYEEVGTSSETYSDEGHLSCEATLRVAWGSRHAVANDILLNRRIWPKGDGGLSPKAAQITISPDQSLGAASGQIVDPAWALLRISYTTKVVDVFSEELAPSAQFVTLDHRLFRWGNGTGMVLREEEAPGYRVLSMQYVKTEFFAQAPLNPLLLSAPGQVHNAAFTPPKMGGLTFPTESLLFEPPTISAKYKSDGSVEYNVVKRWSVNYAGWNTFFRAATGTWVQIYRAGSGTPYKPYTPANLSSLLS